MLNKYPLWKNLLIIFIIFIGTIYALPNLFVDDYAIQISGVRNKQIDEKTLESSLESLRKNNIAIKGHSLDNSLIVIRLNNGEDQLSAKEKIEKDLGDGYSVALNLAPTTPKILSMIGGSPIKLGLDLLGGVRFVMDVDMNTAITRLQNSLQQTVDKELLDNGINKYKITSGTNGSIMLNFDTAELQKQAKNILESDNNFTLNSNEANNQLILNLKQERLASERTKAVEQNIAILRKRVDELGVAEPVIQRQGAESIVVELAGIQDTARAKEILGATATLEFRKVKQTYNQLAQSDELDRMKKGFISPDAELKQTTNGEPILLYKKTILTGDHISNAQSGRDQNSNVPQVSISLDSEGGKQMKEFTKYNVGSLMATVYSEYKDLGKKDANGKVILEKKEEVINYATIQGVFSSQFQVTGLSAAEASHLAILLRSGALIAPLQIVEEKTIGPSLGADNIKKGLHASLGGLLISALFMLFYYRKFGVIANLALIANLLILIAVMSLLPGATLSMPGIAGIVLSIAMALDANILIYERIKEEYRSGLSVQRAIDQGYSGAFSSIFDANLTTILKAFVLYVLGSGPVKGFAITLALGVAISMFTAIIGTRALVNWRYGNKKIAKLSI